MLTHSLLSENYSFLHTVYINKCTIVHEPHPAKAKPKIYKFIYGLVWAGNQVFNPSAPLIGNTWLFFSIDNMYNSTDWNTVVIF